MTRTKAWLAPSSSIFDSAIEQIRQNLKTTKTVGFDAAAALRLVAYPRLVGTAGWLRARENIRNRFAALGYEARELRFGMSSVPGRFAFAAAGALLALASFLGAAFLLIGRPGWALISLVACGELIAIIALTLNRATERFRSGRVVAKNMLFQKPGAKPRWILVAHYDSKSQLVPLLFRAPAAFLAGAAWLKLLVDSTMALVVPIGPVVPFLAGTVGMISGVLLALSWAGNESPGALDNASGVAALLGVAEREVEKGDIAFLLTDAEELGLYGARAATPALSYVEGAINIDGLDDKGTFRVFERFGIPRTGFAPHLAMALMGAAAAHDLPVQRRDVPLGLLLDHMPITRAGIPAVTLSRGTPSTLARIHRPQDDLSRLSGEGVSRGVDLLTAALAILRSTTNGKPRGAGDGEVGM